MVAVVGFVTAGIGLLAGEFGGRPARRYIDTLTLPVIVEERNHDELAITEHPVEYGAAVADHVYMRPKEVVLRCGFSASPNSAGLLNGLVAAVTGTIQGVSNLINGPDADLNTINTVYKRFLALQSKGQPFDVLTWRRKYTNMLIKSLLVTTDKRTFLALDMTVTLQQVIIANTKTITLGDPANMAQPAKTAPTQDMGTKRLVASA